FQKRKKIGEQYHQAVRTQYEHGATFSRPKQGAFTLNAAAAGQIDKALVDAYQFVLKSSMDYETFYKALSKGELAYGSSIDELLKNMSESSRKYLEIDMWHGQSLSGIGVVSAVDGGAEKFTISKATWAPGNWVGAEGMVVQAFFQTVTPLDTMRSGDMVVTGVDPENRDRKT